MPGGGGRAALHRSFRHLTGDDACVDIAALICQVVGNVGACASERTVFLTSMTFNGDLGGVAGADAKCQAAADAPLSIVPIGTYLAWISDAIGNSPSTKFSQSTLPYVPQRRANTYLHRIGEQRAQFTEPNTPKP